MTNGLKWKDRIGAVPKRRYNERLGRAIRAQGTTLHALAGVVGVAETTVERWYYESRIPRPRHRVLAAEALGVTDGWLWPAAKDPSSQRRAMRQNELGAHGEENPADPKVLGRDVLHIFTDVGAVPADFLPTLVRTARDLVHVASDSRAFLDALGFDDEGAQEEWSRTLLDVRILLPRSLNWRTWQQLVFTPVEMRVADDLGRVAYLRVDDYMIAVGASLGLGTMFAPALLLKRLSENGIFDSYAKGFDDAWSAATLDRLFTKHRNRRQ